MDVGAGINMTKSFIMAQVVTMPSASTSAPSKVIATQERQLSTTAAVEPREPGQLLPHGGNNIQSFGVLVQATGNMSKASATRIPTMWKESASMATMSTSSSSKMLAVVRDNGGRRARRSLRHHKAPVNEKSRDDEDEVEYDDDDDDKSSSEERDERSQKTKVKALHDGKS
jgi:hypothetical protein